MDFVNWQYCKSLNEINQAILSSDEEWLGLNDARQIISIAPEANGYLVVWRADHEIVRGIK